MGQHHPAAADSRRPPQPTTRGDATHRWKRARDLQVPPGQVGRPDLLLPCSPRGDSLPARAPSPPVPRRGYGRSRPGGDEEHEDEDENEDDGDKKDEKVPRVPPSRGAGAHTDADPTSSEPLRGSTPWGGCRSSGAP